MAKKKGKKKARLGGPPGRAPKRKSAGAKARTFKAAAAKRRSKAMPKKVAQKKIAVKIPVLSPKLTKKLEVQEKKAEALLAHGRQRGFVTYDEILKSFPNIETDVV